MNVELLSISFIRKKKWHANYKKDMDKDSDKCLSKCQ